MNPPENANTAPKAPAASKPVALSAWLVWGLSVAATLSVAAALLVAVGGFTWGLPDETHIQSYHPDEQNVTYSLRNMNPSKFDFNPRFFGNPSLYTYQVGALALAASLVGALPRETDEGAWLSQPHLVKRFYQLGRALSLLYAALSVWVVYLVTRKLTGEKVPGLVAAVLLLSIPAFAVHSHYMTVNSSAVFWSLVTMLFALRLREDPSWKNYTLAGVFAGLAISTKLNNAFLPLAVAVAHLQACRGRGLKAALLGPRLWLAGVVCIVVFFAGSPYYVLSWGSVQGDPHNSMNMAALMDFSTPLGVMWHDFWNHLSAANGQVLAVIFLAAVPMALAVTPRVTAPLAAVALPFLALAVKSGFWAFPSRMLPLLAILAILLATVLFKARSKVLRALLGATLTCGLIFTAPWNLAYSNLMRGRHVRAESSLWITAAIPPGERIIVLDTPYFESPDVVYENALHPDTGAWPKYDVLNLAGDFSALSAVDGRWLVVPERFERRVTKATGLSLGEFAAQSGFLPHKTFSRDFEAFGVRLRDWIPADMVQNYPVYVFHRDPLPPQP